MDVIENRTTRTAVVGVVGLVAGAAAVVCALARIDLWVVLVAAALGAAAGILSLRQARYRAAGTIAVALAVLAIVLAVITPRAPDEGVTSAPSSSPGSPHPTPSTTANPETASPNPPGELPSIGETSVSDAGVAMSVDSMECGLSTAGEGTPTPEGQYCALTFTVRNDSSEGIDLIATDFEGRAEDTTYEAVPGIGRLGDDMSATTVLPGSTVEGTLFYDVPLGEKLDSLVLSADWFEAGFDVSAKTGDG